MLAHYLMTSITHTTTKTSAHMSYLCPVLVYTSYSFSLAATSHQHLVVLVSFPLLTARRSGMIIVPALTSATRCIILNPLFPSIAVVCLPVRLSVSARKLLGAQA
jgi:hypothetical protein